MLSPQEEGQRQEGNVKEIFAQAVNEASAFVQDAAEGRWKDLSPKDAMLEVIKRRPESYKRVVGASAFEGVASFEGCH